MSSAQFGEATVGTPDRAVCTWLVRAPAGTEVTVEVRHDRAGSDALPLTLAGPHPEIRS
jgi:hypothetical protein